MQQENDCLSSTAHLDIRTRCEHVWWSVCVCVFRRVTGDRWTTFSRVSKSATLSWPASWCTGWSNTIRVTWRRTSVTGDEALRPYEIKMCRIPKSWRHEGSGWPYKTILYQNIISWLIYEFTDTRKLIEWLRSLTVSIHSPNRFIFLHSEKYSN